MPDSIEKTPTQHTSANNPASGTYGEKAELTRLNQALPESGARPGSGPEGPGPVPGGLSPGAGGEPGRPAGPGAPPGVPGALMHGTERPGQPLGTPLAQQGAPMGGAQSSQEARFIVLQALAESDEVSEATREWASIVIDMLSEV